MKRAYLFDIKVVDSSDKYGRGNSGLIFAKTIERAKEMLKRRFCWRKTQRIVAIEVKRTNTGIHENWSYSFDKYKFGLEVEK